MVKWNELQQCDKGWERGIGNTGIRYLDYTWCDIVLFEGGLRLF